MDRLERLLAARTDSEGNPLSGYKLNVAAIKKAIADRDAKGLPQPSKD